MSSSLSSLLKHPDADPATVLSAAESALSQSSGNVTARHAKVVALLKLDRFEDAIREFEHTATDQTLRQSAGLEYAYGLYKTGRLQEAREVVAELKGDNGARHLEAQSAYRSEDFSTAARIYEELWQNRTGGEESDLRINRGAVNAQLCWNRQGEDVPLRPGREDLEVFETAYNAACVSLARGEFAQGEVLLKRAKDLCTASEDLSGDEKQAELLPISVQQLFALSSQGKTEAAAALAQEIAVADIPDMSTRQIAQINRIALNGNPTNPFLAQRMLESLPELQPSDPFFGAQSTRMEQNRLALDLLVSKFNAVSKTSKARRSSQTTPTVDSTSVINSSFYAAAQAQNQLGKVAINVIKELNRTEPPDVGFVLVLVQLYILTKNHGAAIKVMENMLQSLETSSDAHAQEVRYAPGLVAILVSLYGIEKRRTHIQKELGKAASYWKRKNRIHPRLFNAAGLALLESGRPEDLAEAGEIFEAAREADPKDVSATAGYVAALAESQPEKVAKAAESLTAIEKLTAGIDAAALDQAGVPQIKPAASTAGQKRAAVDTAKPAKKRARKSRLPKDHDPEKKPDPERWLPLRDRSTYRPKGKKGKQKQQALTQGGISKEGAEEASESAKTSVLKASGGGVGKAKKGKKKK